MIVLSIILGVIIVALMWFGFYMSDNKLGDFDMGVTFGVIITLFMIAEVITLGFILEKPSPTAMDVYKGKTTLEYKVVDGMKIDSIVVFRDSIYGR